MGRFVNTILDQIRLSLFQKTLTIDTPKSRKPHSSHGKGVACETPPQQMLLSLEREQHDQQ